MEEGARDLLHSSGQYFHDLDANTMDLLIKLWIAQSLGGEENQGSEREKQKQQDPK